MALWPLLPPQASMGMPPPPPTHTQSGKLSILLGSAPAHLRALPLRVVMDSFPGPQGEAPIPWRSEEAHYGGLREAEVSSGQVNFVSHSCTPRGLMWLSKPFPMPDLRARGIGVSGVGVGGVRECWRGVEFQRSLGERESKSAEDTAQGVLEPPCHLVPAL